MFNRLDAIVKKYEDIKKELMNPEVVSDFNKIKELSKEESDLKETVEVYNEYKKVLDNLEQAKEMASDPELKEMAMSEIETLTKKEEELYKRLEILLVPKDEYDGKNVIMEIRGAAGGDEANIFAGDLFRMYSHYADNNGWKIEVIHEIAGTSGGYSQIEFIIKGDNVYSKLKYESGSHRVQRVPATETQGRVHTSTATVLVMPEIETANIDIKESDIKMDALNLLKIRINEEARLKEEQELGQERKNKIGTGDRSEKIRTYNYPQNRVTDHRINFSIMSLDRVMDGWLDPIIEALQTEDLKLKLAGAKME